MSLVITEFLKGALGELYYKEGYDQKSWAYISLKSIYNDNNSSRFKDDNILVFKKGFHRINVKILESIIPEIRTCSPTTNNNNFT
jgi:hypothetical protein